MIFKHLLISCLLVKLVQERVYLGIVLFVLLFVSGCFGHSLGLLTTGGSFLRTRYKSQICVWWESTAGGSGSSPRPEIQAVPLTKIIPGFQYLYSLSPLPISVPGLSFSQVKREESIRLWHWARTMPTTFMAAYHHKCCLCSRARKLFLLALIFFSLTQY